MTYYGMLCYNFSEWALGSQIELYEVVKLE